MLKRTSIIIFAISFLLCTSCLEDYVPSSDADEPSGSVDETQFVDEDQQVTPDKQQGVPDEEDQVVDQNEPVDDGTVVIDDNEEPDTSVQPDTETVDTENNGSNKKPVVSFTLPTGGVVAPDLGVVVEASDPDGTVVEVFLFINDNLVRREGAAPYEWGLANNNKEDVALLNLNPGTYQLRAEANDNEGATGVATMSVTVSGDNSDNYVDGPGKIIYPWRATTVALKRGESFVAMFDAQPDQLVNSAILRGPYNKVFPSISVETGNWVYDKTSGNRYNTRVTVHVPSGAPEDRYDLILRTSIGDEVSLGSVKVVKEYKNIFYILHLSDTHTFQGGDDLSLYKVSTITEIANILNPEMVFVTGDNLYFPKNDRVDRFYNGTPSKGLLGIHDFNAPTFLACGNHDWAQGDNPSDIVSKALHYNEHYGLHTYNFSFGNGRYFVYNNGWGNKTQQNNDAVSWFNNAGPGTFRLAAAHMKGGSLSTLHSDVDLDLIIAGHNHYIADENPDSLDGDAIQYVASSIRDHAPEFNLFRVNINNGTYETVSGPTAQVVAIENPGSKDNPSAYVPKLIRTFTNPNNGTSIENTAVIDNKFSFALPEARVRFVMPIGGNYSVSNGSIVQFFDGEEHHIVDVNVRVEAGRKTEVNIY